MGCGCCWHDDVVTTAVAAPTETTRIIETFGRRLGNTDWRLASLDMVNSTHTKSTASRTSIATESSNTDRKIRGSVTAFDVFCHLQVQWYNTYKEDIFDALRKELMYYTFSVPRDADEIPNTREIAKRLTPEMTHQLASGLGVNECKSVDLFFLISTLCADPALKACLPRLKTGRDLWVNAFKERVSATIRGLNINIRCETPSSAHVRKGVGLMQWGTDWRTYGYLLVYFLSSLLIDP